MLSNIKLRRALILSLSFLIPVLICLITLCGMGFWPNGDKTVLFMDLKGEYTEYLASYRYIFGGDDSLFFNWSRSMGGNVFGLYAFYGGGILSFITCMFPLTHIYIAVEILILLMIGLSGLSMSVFLEWGVGRDKGRLAVIIFSVCYAMMSYNMVYANCFMWLNGSIFLPLVLLGIEQLIRGRKGLVFYLSLTLSMINNYYTAFMICIFTVLYITFRMISLYGNEKSMAVSASTADNKKEKIGAVLFLSKKNIREILIRYIVLALLSAMSAAPVLITVFKDLVGGKLTSTVDYDSGHFYFPFDEIFRKLLPGQYDSITFENIHPQLYSGLIVLVFVILFFLRKNRSIREKTAALVFIGIMLISFWSVDIDKIWHGFQIPHWFPFRYAFVFGGLMVYLGYRSYDDICNEDLLHRLQKKTKFSFVVVECAVTAVLALISCIELSTNAKNYIKGLGDDFGYMDIAEYDDFYNKCEPLISKVRELDNGLYRMDKDFEFSKNDSMLFGYKGMTHYSSTYNARVNLFTPKVGLAQSWYWNSGYGATPLVDSLFGVRYRLAKNALPDSYRLIDKNEDVGLYENTDALPIAFAASSKLADVKLTEGVNVFDAQNEMLGAITGRDEKILNNVEFERTDSEGETLLSFKAPSDDPLYLYMHPTDGYWGEIYVNDQFVNNYFSTETTCAVYLGSMKVGETVNVSVRSDNAHFDTAYISSFDMKAYQDVMSGLQENAIALDSFGAGCIEGRIGVSDPGMIATTIPYDEGYTVKIDGSEVSYEPWMDTFIAVKLSPGEHVISISYMPAGFAMGLITAAAGIILFILYIKFTGGKKNADNIQ